MPSGRLLSEQIWTPMGSAEGIDPARRPRSRLVVARLPEAGLLGQVELLVRRCHLARAVEDQGAARSAAVLGSVDDPTHEADAGLGRRLGLGAAPAARPSARRRRRRASFVAGLHGLSGISGSTARSAPRSAASARRSLEAYRPIGLPEDLRDEGDGELAIGSGGSGGGGYRSGRSSVLTPRGTRGRGSGSGRRRSRAWPRSGRCRRRESAGRAGPARR